MCNKITQYVLWHVFYYIMFDMKRQASNDQELIELRSEKVRNLIGQIPPFLVRWGNTILVIILVLLGLPVG